VVDTGVRVLALLLAVSGAGPQAPALPAPPSVSGPAAPAVTAPDAPAPGSKQTERKPAGHTTAPADRKAPSRTAERVPPPSTTVAALHQELRGLGGDEDHSLASERARLEQLAAEIAKAREALKQETARLEGMLKGGAEARAPGGESDGAPGVPLGSGASRDAMREQIGTVSKAFKGMKPEQAAAIVAHLDRLLAAEVLRRMRPADAGLVLAQLKPDLAADLATTIAIRRPIVDDGPKKEGRK
jgi:flagellar motility protein MotE (MotC chaperone)